MMLAEYYIGKHAEFEALCQRYVDHGAVSSRTVEQNMKGVEQHVVHSMACCGRVGPGLCHGVMRWPVAYASGKTKQDLPKMQQSKSP